MRAGGAVVGAGDAHEDGATASERVVRAAFVLRIVRIEGQLEAVGHVPCGIEAQRPQLVLLHAALLLKAEVLGAGNLADVGWGRYRATGVEFDVGVVAVLQPHALLATILGDLVGRIGVVQGQGHRIGRRELQHRLAVDAFSFELGERVAQVIGPGVQRAHRGRIDHPRVARHGAGPRLHVPVVLGGLHRTALSLLIAGAHAHAEGLFRIGVAEDAGQLRCQVVTEWLAAVGDSFRAGTGDDALMVERPRGEDVDGGTDATAGYIGLAGLVDLDAVDGFGSQLGEVEGAGTAVNTTDGDLPGRTECIGAGHLAPVEGHHVELRAEATRRHLCTFTITSFDRDAGDALQGLCQVGVGELADVLSTDHIHHAGRVALDVHRLAEAVADAGDLHGIQLFRTGRVLLLGDRRGG
ncbi:hypothetical protein D3C81_900300 [compost metagenome]